jgi:signal transduction histidine kinase
VQVKDTGVGIRQEFLSHVFEAFHQDNTTSSKLQSGIGVGLTIAHQLVELHGGTIQVESQEGQGATFTVTLPGLSQVRRASTPR